MFVPGANPSLAFSVAGPGELVGLDNGDPTDTTSYEGTSRKAFNGKAPYFGPPSPERAVAVFFCDYGRLRATDRDWLGGYGKLVVPPRRPIATNLRRARG